MKEEKSPQEPGPAAYRAGSRRSAILAAFITLGILLTLWWGSRLGYDKWLLIHERQDAMAALTPHGNALTIAIDRRLALLKGLRAFVEVHASAPTLGKEFEVFAAELHAGTRGIRNFTIAPGGVNRFVHPLAGNETVLGYNLLQDPRPNVRVDVSRAIQSRRITLSGPYELRQGGSGLVARLALYQNDSFWGLVAMALDVAPVLEEAGLQPTTGGLNFALRDSAAEVFFGASSVFAADPVVYRVKLPEGSWEFAAAPSEDWGASTRKALGFFDGATLAIAFLMAGLVYLVVNRQARLAFAVRERTQEITNVNEQLEADIAARKRIEEELRIAQQGLETRVQERTRELAKTNDELQLEIRGRRQIEQALRGSEARFQAMVDTSTRVIFLKNTEGRYLLVNREYESLFHITREQIRGKTDYDLFSKEVAEALRTNDLKVLEAGAPLEFEEVVPQDDGPHTYIANKFPLYNSQGVAYGVCGIATDITDRKHLEEDLKAGRIRAENWFRTLIETTQDAVVSIDRQGRIVLFNPAAERIFGYNEAEIEGQKVNILMAEPYASEHDNTMALFESAGEKRAVGRIRTVAARRKNGEVFPIELSVTEVESEGEVRYAAFIRDISEKARLQEQLIENERLAAIGTTTSMFAHEIGNPLNGMSMTIQLLERRLARHVDGAGEKITAAVKRLKDEIGRLTRLLEDFRSLSRRESYIFRPISLSTVAGEVFAIEEEDYRARGIQVVQDFPPDLPPAVADRSKLKQALLNLCKNAVEAMPKGGRLTLRAYSSGERLNLEILDTGIGIPAGVDIFEPFTTTKSSGTGLGMMIVRQIVAAHGGSIGYSSELGKGTVFRLSLPAAL